MSGSDKPAIDAARWDQAPTELWAELREKYPDIDFDERTFAAIRAELPPGYDRHIAPEELFLLCGCREGNPVALRLAGDQLLGSARLALRQMQLDGEVAEEAEQLVWAKFLVADETGELPLLKYVGKGKLTAFLRVSAVRTAISLLRREGKYVPQGDGGLESSLAEDGRDLDLAIMKSSYRDLFRSSLEQAVAALSPRQRTLLRLHHLERVTGDQLARMYQVHRATVNRWLAEARTELATATREHLASQVSVTPSEFQSLARLVLSSIDVSLHRVLAA